MHPTATVLCTSGLAAEAKIAREAGFRVILGAGDRDRTEALIETAAPRADCLVSFGVAGALAPHLRSGDVIAFMQGYWKSPNTVFVSSSGVRRGWQAVLDRYRQAYPDRQAMGRLTFSDLEITQLCSDAALILGHWELQRRRDHLGGVFTLVARRLPEGWRIVSDHTSTVSSP